MADSLYDAEQAARRIGRIIGPSLPKGWGFTLMLYTFGVDGFSTYISNAERPNMILALKEMIEKLEKDGDRIEFTQPNNN